MPITIKVEQLIHVAIDAESGFINQHLLIKLFEFIVKKSNINTLNVSFNENDRADAECCKFIEECNLKSKKEIIPEKNEAEPVDVDNQDNNSTLGCDFEAVEASPESIYRLPSEAIISEPDSIEENAEKISVPSTLNLDQFLEEKHEYNLHANDVHVIADIIEQLYGKIKKINSVIKVLQKSIKTCSATDSDGSPDSEIDAFKQIAFSDMGSAFEIQKHDYDRSKLDENLNKLDISAKGDMFREIFGRTQKRKNLHLGLSVGNFREFDLDYRMNFLTIHSFLELHRDMFKKIKSDIKKIKMNNLNKEEFLVFKKAISLSHIQMKNDIKEYILRDPEAMGIVRFFKDGSCMSCGKPAMIKITNTAPLSERKEAPKKSGSRNSFKMKRSYISQSKATTPTGLKCNVVDLPTEQAEDSSKKIDWEYRLKRLQIIHKGNPNIQEAEKTLRQMHIKPKKIWKC